MGEEGAIAYPYSTRELYPDDGAEGALANVFSFDAWDDAATAAVDAALREHGSSLEK
eukprot:gene4905-25656_t